MRTGPIPRKRPAKWADLPRQLNAKQVRSQADHVERLLARPSGHHRLITVASISAGECFCASHSTTFAKVAGSPAMLKIVKDSVLKVMYLAMQRASQRWSRSVKDWTGALNQLSIMFGDRLTL